MASLFAGAPRKPDHGGIQQHGMAGMYTTLYSSEGKEKRR